MQYLNIYSRIFAVGAFSRTRMAIPSHNSRSGSPLQYQCNEQTDKQNLQQMQQKEDKQLCTTCEAKNSMRLFSVSERSHVPRYPCLPQQIHLDEV